MASKAATSMLMPTVAPTLSHDFEGWLEPGDGVDVGAGKFVDIESGDAPLADALAPIVFAGVPVGVKCDLSLDASADA